MLELRPECEGCGTALPPESAEARICSFECTFCAACVDGPLGGVCPNCGGGFVPRPIRPAAKLASKPPRHLTMRTERALVYAQPDGYRPLELDLYLPGDQHRRPLPVVVYVHGGGWRVSSRHSGPRETRDWDRSVFERLTDAGFAVAAVEYRYSGEVTAPGPVDDAKDAVRWLRASAAARGLDPERFVAWGQSAGGHLAASVVLDPAVGPFRAACCWYTLSDLPAMMGHDDFRFVEHYLGGPIETDPDRARANSPISLVHGGAPPFLLQHGTADTMAPFAQSVALRDALADVGVAATLEAVDGADHFFGGHDDVGGIFERMVDYLRAHV